MLSFRRGESTLLLGEIKLRSVPKLPRAEAEQHLNNERLDFRRVLPSQPTQTILSLFSRPAILASLPISPSMSKFVIVLAAMAFSLASCVAAQSRTPDLQSCAKLCRKFRGQCNVSLVNLARTPCFDTKTRSARTCDCNVDLNKLQSLKSTDVVRDCVIPRRLFNFESAVDIKAKFINVHITSISNVGTLRQSGDIRGSTLCEWKCVGRNRFQNCVLAGSVIRSTIRLLSAGQEATLSIGGEKFSNNKVDTIRSDKDISIGCKGGFDSNTVKLLATSRFGRFSSVLGTSITNNRFDQFTTNDVTSFADIDGNTAGIATVGGVCTVLRVKSPILVDNFLGLPAGDRECAEMFEKA